MPNELKPCPFCGGEAMAYEIPAHKHGLVGFPDYSGCGFVECQKCSAAIAENSKKEAIAAWNRRANDEQR